MKRKNNYQITDRDYKILRFLWKWKIVSTQGIAVKFYPKAKPFTAYRRLLCLQSGGYIDCYPVEGRFHEAWMLKEKGFKYILPHLGELESKGYKSSSYPHDFLATAFHLGEWLTNQPANSQTYSEQQLRCYAQDLWPHWVPSSSLHRPDGYSIMQSSDKRIIVAFEAELSLKSKSRYESAVAFYDGQESINYVFWLIDTMTTLNTIRGYFKNFQMRDILKHQFILLKDFKENGWRASIIEGSLIKNNLSQLMLHKSYTLPTQKPLICVTQALLDSKKRPVVSNF